VLADEARTRQVLGNLLGNAVKYTSRGAVILRVEAAGPGRLRFEVSDSGPGLTPEELSLAFTPFKRIGRTAAGVPGAGLGLSLSRSLAHLMTGELGAGSAIGRGSRFWLELPYDAAAGPSQRVVAADPGQPLRVLVVEPDSLSTVMLRAALDQLGHRMLHTHDGGRALELLRSCEVDALLVGGTDSAEIVRGVRAMPSSAAELRIAALLGPEAQDADTCLRAGADAIIRKPVTVGAVARALAAAAAVPQRAEAA
jgi:CheY-like chemotaxis protein